MEYNNPYLSNGSNVNGMYNQNNYTPPQYQTPVNNIGNQMNTNLPNQNINYSPNSNNQFWAAPVQQGNNVQQEKEYILLDGSSPTKKRKYVFVEEIDVPVTSFTLDDIKKIISDEFDRRFGEEKQ